jgi:outer membrane protein
MTLHPRLRPVVMLAFALLPVAAMAQDTLTLDQAMQAAQARNASLRAARAGNDEAAARADAARSGFFPRLAVTESWQRGDQPVFVFSSLLSAREFTSANFAIDRLNHPDPTSFFRTTIGAEQLIYDGGRQKASSAHASLQHEAAQKSADEVEAGVAVATVQAYGRILIAQSARRTAAAAVASAREDRARAERRRDAGMATEADVLALAVHVAGLEQRAIQAAGDEAIARADLNRWTGDRVEREFQVIEPPAPTVANESLATLLAEAEASRPEIARAIAMQKAADAARRESRAALIPQIAAQAALDIAGTQFDSRASSWIVGTQFQWTFATGGGQLAATKAAAASTARARAEADEARAYVQVEVVTAQRRLEAARAREVVGRAAVDQARESERIIRDRFDAGMAAVNDVLRASTALLDAAANRTSAAVEALVSAADLRRSVGRMP